MDATPSPLPAALEEAGLQLVSRLERSRTVGDVEGHFAAFLGSEPVRRARALPLGSELREPAVEALRRGLKGLYEGARSWGHALARPYGYAGDFAALELVYEQAAHPDTRTAWGALVDEWGTRTALSRAVAARKDALRTWLQRELEARADSGAGGEKLAILSIASGSAREIRELPAGALAQASVALLDSDPRALACASGYLRSRPRPTDVRVVVGDAVQGGARLQEELQGPFDVVYSPGLFDHLPDAPLLRCLKRFVRQMAEGGRLVFSLQDHRFYDAWFYDWLHDWRFVARVEEDGPSLAGRAGLRVTEQLQVEGGAVNIFVCRKG
jgi:SAM-dependent methyltransferase